MMNKKIVMLLIMLLSISLLCGCVDQKQGKKEETKGKTEKESRIIATSPAVAEICNRLNIDLVGVCSSSVSKLPKRYQKLPKVGTAMSPDMEKVSALKPDWILSPASLRSDLQPKYEQIGVDWGFLNLKSVPGMYRSIEQLGELFGKEQEANEEVQKFQDFYKSYSKKNKTKKRKKVLILMGLPGSYIIATENSYVGNLVEMAGGDNVYAGTNEEFLTVNTEELKKKEPDVILRAAHALPDKVVAMFKKDFKENDIWKHFEAVKKNRVYDLKYELFGMSANFSYPQALDELQKILYPEGESNDEK